MNSKNRIFRFFCLLTGLIIFIENVLSPAVSAQEVRPLFLNAAVVQPYHPALLRGMRLDPADALQFRFVVDTGDAGLDQDELYLESEKLIKYFLTCLTVPEKDLWVNLSPVEHDRITSDVLSKTDLGRVLLSQDYLLKKMSASLMQPDSESGRRFWDEVTSRMYEQGQTAEIPSGIFHKIWITPASADLYAEGDFVLIMKSRLKVMLEEDYLGNGERGMVDNNTSPTNHQSPTTKTIIRQTILPIIEKEVNEGETFAPLRQIFHALILAKWFKANFKTSFVHQVYADQSKINGVDGSDPRMIEGIYADYLAAFSSDGHVQEEYDPAQGAIVARQYFSGGFEDNPQSYMNAAGTAGVADFSSSIAGEMAMINVDVQLVFGLQKGLSWVGVALLSVLFLTWSAPVDAATHPSVLTPGVASNISFDADHALQGFEPIEPDHAAEVEQQFYESDFYKMLESPDTIPAAVDTLKDIFSRYYENMTALAEADIHQSSDSTFYQTTETNITNEIFRLFNLAGKPSNMQQIVPLIQEELKKHGIYFVLRLHSGFFYKERFINRLCMDIVLAPIVSSESRTDIAVGPETVSYTKLVVDSNLIDIPEYVPHTVELVDFNDNIVLLPEAYRDFLEVYYEIYVVQREQFSPPYRQEGSLWWKQWGDQADTMGKDEFLDFATEKVMGYYLRHGEQHLADRKAINEGRLKFPNTFPELPEEINQSAHMELRVLLRQMMDGVLPYQALLDFSNFYILATQFGDQSEYGLAAKIGYKALNDALRKLFLDAYLSKGGTLGDVAIAIRREKFEKEGFAGFYSNKFEFMSSGWEALTPTQIPQLGGAVAGEVYPDMVDPLAGAGQSKDDAQLAQDFFPGGIALDTAQMNYAVRGSGVSKASLLSNPAEAGRISGFIPVHLKITILQNIVSFTASN